MLRLAAFVCLFARALLADGGTVLLQTQAPPFVLTVFRSGTPKGEDLSVLVQESGVPVLDAQVAFEFGSQPNHVSAGLGQGQNKLLYSAVVDLPSPGDWPFTVVVDRGTKHVSTSSILQISRPAVQKSAFLGYVAIVPIAILLFILRSYLVRRRSVARV